MAASMLRPAGLSITTRTHPRTACAARIVHRAPRVVARMAEVEVEVKAAQAEPISGKVFVFDAAAFDDLLQRSKERLVIVDVFTQWCGPCKMIAPELEKMAEEFGDKIIMSKIDCTSQPENKKWAMGQSVKALPTFLLFKDGKRVTDMTGAKAANLRKLIESHM